MAILSAMNSWNNLLWPLIVLNQDTKFTLPIGLGTTIIPLRQRLRRADVRPPMNVAPVSVQGAQIENGTLTVKLPALSWNMLRLK